MNVLTRVKLLGSAAAAMLLTVVPGLHAQSITDGLTAYFNFDNNINAQAGTMMPGKVYKGTPRYSTGMLGGAASFLNDQSSGQPSDWAITLGNIESVYSGDFSLALWVKTKSGSGAWIGNKNWSSGGNIGYCLDSYYDGFLNYCALYGSRVDLGAAVRDGTWHHVAVVFSRIDNSVITFVDGTNAAQAVIGPVGNESLNAGYPTLIGSTGPGYYAAKADLDDLGIWSRALSADEVSAIYSNGIKGTNLVGNAPSGLYFAQSPKPATCYETDYVTLSGFGGGGVGNYAFQWLKDGSAVADATNNTLPFAPVALTNAGSYQLILSDGAGSITSAPVALIVGPTTTITAGMIGYWAFNETTGYTAADQTYKNDAIIYGYVADATTWGSGRIGNALKSMGAALGQCVSVSNFSEATNRLTISAWGLGGRRR